MRQNSLSFIDTKIDPQMLTINLEKHLAIIINTSMKVLAECSVRIKKKKKWGEKTKMEGERKREKINREQNKKYCAAE